MRLKYEAHHRNPLCLLSLVFAFLLPAGAALAQREVESGSALHLKEFRHSDRDVTHTYQRPDTLAVTEALTQLRQLEGHEASALLDSRTGRFSSLVLSKPMIAGKGFGNNLKAAAGTREEQAWQALLDYLAANEDSLGVSADELSTPRITNHVDGDIIQIHVNRVFDGIVVRDSNVNATFNSGNLVLLDVGRWSPRNAQSNRPTISVEEATAAALAHLSPFATDGTWRKDHMTFLTLENSGQGQGYRYQKAWVISPTVVGEGARFEVLVEAFKAEVLEAADTNAYAEVKGGVYPVSNDGVVPDGVEQGGTPMPYISVNGQFADTGGNVALTGSLTASLSGQFVNMNDNCGASSLIQNDGIDWGTSGGADCVTPGFGGAGNTHSSRTGYYELSKLIEMALGWVPGNAWLNSQLTSNMNINNTCNAFWNGSTVNFYRSGGGCANTGEIAGIFDHEWGHGYDDNDAVPTIASPSGEGVADIYTALRLNDSCIGRNFFTSPCSGYGDPCRSCTGVRDIDYLERQSGQPHTFTWSNANCSSVHCRGAVYSEAVWSLWKRILQSAPYNLDNNTAYEITNRLSFIGAGNVGTWFSGSPPFGGCGSTSGYLQYLAVDDDDGNLNNGTPHMQAIFDAFNDQEIACNNLTVQDSGCAGTPTTAPAVTATPVDKSIQLSWNVVSGASSYAVFRTEGVFGCDFGKVRLGETTGTTWIDNGLQNGRQYSYVVIPMGSGPSCFGNGSSCINATPAAGPNLGIDEDSAATSIVGGDGDDFLDNCETGTTTVDVTNTGLGSLTNVRIVSVTPSNGGISLTTSLPVAVSPSSLGQGATGTGSFSYLAGGLTFGETLTFQVEVTADELASSRFGTLTVNSTETDLTFTPSQTYSFESGTEGWTTVQGTFNRSNSGGGANGTSWHEQSSSNLDNQCDQITSPEMVLSATSTLTLSNNFDIEPQFTNGAWYDRANVGVVVGGSRSLVTPDGGRLYNASGAQGTCGTAGQGGWADTAASWTESFFSAGALGSAGLAGEVVQLDIRYGTDASLNGTGFRFDEVTVTDVSFLGPDDSCGCTEDADCDNGLFCDGAETCDAGVCQAGTAPNCDDGVSCTVDSCNEGTDSCDNTANDGLCDNGLFCDGAETCNATLGCQLGAAPNCDDDVSCTADACNEVTDSCDYVPDDAVCDDGLFCNGAEYCDLIDDCQPCGVPCGGGACDEADDVCVECTVDAECDDSLFCNGVETCVNNACQAGSDPCGTSESCAEAGDVCVAGGNCSHSTGFESGADGWTQGGDTCTTGSFIVGTPDATTWQVGGGNPGQAFFTQNNPGGIGTDDVDGGTCEALSPVVDCSGQPSADVSLDYYHGQRDNADGAGDGFTIEILNNGVVVDTLVSIGDVTNNPAWTAVTTNVANPGNIQLRVRATDDAGGGDIVEGGIDNVTISAGGAPPTCTTLEDFESGLNGWTNSGDCTTGTYVATTPTQVVDTGVTTQPAGANSGVNAAFTATNTTAGSNDVDGGNCILTSPDLGAANGDLSVAWFHGQRDAGDDPAGDFFTLEYSTDGGANWNTLAQNGDSTSTAAWSTSTASINGNSLQVRVQCSDGAGPGDLVECGIDDVEVCSAAARSASTVPTTDDNSSAVVKMLPPIPNPQLEWLRIARKNNPNLPCSCAAGWKTRHFFGDSLNLPPNLPAALKPFCLYTFQGSTVTQDDIDALDDIIIDAAHGTATKSLNISEHEATRLIVKPAAASTCEMPAPVQEHQTERFLETAGAIGNLVSPQKTVRIVLLDTAPTRPFNPIGFLGNMGPRSSLHGPSLGALADALLCADGNGCGIEIASRLTLPYQSFHSYEVQAKFNDGLLGTPLDVADAIWKEIRLHEAEGNGRALILNLSLAWPSDPDMPLDDEVVLEALKAAAAHDILVIAAAGNKPDDCGSFAAGPLLPADWEKIQAPDATLPYEPLIYAVAAYNGQGRKLPSTQPGSLPPLAAYGDHVVVDTVQNNGDVASSANLTGSSAAALNVSVAAAAAWSSQSNASPAQIMQQLYDNGNTVASANEFCLLDESNGACQGGRFETRFVRACATCEVLSSCGCRPGVDVPPPMASDFPACFGTLPVLSSPAACPGPGLDATPWVLPQPASRPCPSCVADDGSGFVYGEIDRSVTGDMLESITVLCDGTAGEIPVNPMQLGSDGFFKVDTWSQTWQCVPVELVVTFLGPDDREFSLSSPIYSVTFSSTPE